MTTRCLTLQRFWVLVVAMASTFGMFDHFGGYAWMFIGSLGLGLGAVAIGFMVRAPRMEAPVQWSPSAA